MQSVRRLSWVVCMAGLLAWSALQAGDERSPEPVVALPQVRPPGQPQHGTILLAHEGHGEPSHDSFDEGRSAGEARRFGAAQEGRPHDLRFGVGYETRMRERRDAMPDAEGFFLGGRKGAGGARR